MTLPPIAHAYLTSCASGDMPAALALRCALPRTLGDCCQCEGGYIEDSRGRWVECDACEKGLTEYTS